jgi:mannosyl-3-phosphoglycerate phosphatase
MREPSQTLVSTDLDGTLLDHFSYSWDAAKASLDYLKEHAIPVVINTSKTRDEVIELQSDMGLSAPFIVENGSAIYFPKNDFPGQSSDLQDADFSVKLLGEKREKILSVLNTLREQGFKYQSYSDWSVEDLVSHTGLSIEKAKKSQLRLYSEPMLWQDEVGKLEQFRSELSRYNLRLLKGGRFYHVLGNSDKGQAIQTLLDLMYNTTTKLICLGDSYNDLDMLSVADVAVLCRSPAHDFPEYVSDNQLIKTQGFGPEGWHEALSSIFNF